MIPNSSINVIFFEEFLDTTTAELFQIESQNGNWEQNFYGYEIRTPIQHLERNFSLDTKVEAGVTWYGSEQAGKANAHFFQKNDQPSLTILQKSISNFLQEPLNTVEQLPYRPGNNKIKGEGLKKHTDGKLLEDTSSIATYVQEDGSYLIIYYMDMEYWIFTPHNTLYVLQYNSENFSTNKITPKDLEHSREAGYFEQFGYQIVSVFRNLKEWKDINGLYRQRWNKEKLIFSVDWKNLVGTRWKSEAIVGIIEKKTNDFHR